ncbi:hypothetical protein NQ314_016961 [Rhamnusium bicolor]|uniref:PiggyBac transposable element-derived protein domain-containing protein n=1 Tax=Rhamnusium bicolor TaxID=1586634 RepID=A0AAV8WUI4_9CUCU|nr:hypothetical protein NQ314_016961 [Rhamnusium bicolor]
MKRFSVFFAAIRFDDHETREERKKNDPVVAISFIFNTSIENCQSIYGLGQSATVDEMLVSFRGRCRLKIGKDSDDRGLSSEDQKFLTPTQAVLCLAV